MTQDKHLNKPPPPKGVDTVNDAVLNLTLKIAGLIALILYIIDQAGN